jgi:hypothetical protein
MRYYFIGFIFIFNFLAAQDSVVSKKWKFTFQFDNRFSSINGTDITIFGAKAGLQYENLLRFGIGGSFIISPVAVEYFNKRTKTTENDKINFWYGSVFVDYIIYKNSRWECFVTEQIGYGTPNFTRETKRLKNDIVSDVELSLFVNEVSGQANYKITNWIGLGAGFGYRHILNSNSVLKSTFNAPIYIVKLVLYPETFLKRSQTKT